MLVPAKDPTAADTREEDSAVDFSRGFKLPSMCPLEERLLFPVALPELQQWLTEHHVETLCCVSSNLFQSSGGPGGTLKTLTEMCHA